MRILVTNDDGIYAPGIEVLAESMQGLGEVIVMAPSRNRSGASSALTLHRPLHVTELAPNRYSVEGGTPTDCVHLAITGFLPEPPDLVVSGINAGANLGDDVFYSGTVAAAIEARFMGLPGVAFSLVDEHKNYATAGVVARNIVKKMDPKKLPGDTILSVNVPDVTPEMLRGYEVTRLGKRHIAEPTMLQQDPRGNTVYWIGLPGEAADAGQGTDFYAVENHKVSVTPLRLDLTHYKTFEQVSNWVSEL
jgi:5'-nucleotidase